MTDCLVFSISFLPFASHFPEEIEAGDLIGGLEDA
jgi:hypothetical protein